MRGLVEAVKRCQHRLQGWSFELQRFGNGQLLLLGKKARVALARRLAVIMHAMLRDGTLFQA